MVTRRDLLQAFTAIAILVVLSGGAQAALVAHYSLDSIAGGTTPDATGLNGDGTLNGNPIIRTTAQIGPAFEFTNSSAQYVGISDPAFGKTAFTASVWMRPDSVGSKGPLSQWTNAGPSPRSMLIRTDGGGNVQTYLRSGTTQTGGTISSTESITTTDFSLVTVAYDGQNLMTYVNGVKSPTVNSFGSPGTAIGEGVLGTMGIGGRGSSELIFDGYIDDVSFFDATLTDAKVRALYTVAREPGLNYDAGKADQLFQVFDGTAPGAAIGTLQWNQAADGTLTGSQGDVVDLGGGNYGVILNASGGGVVSSMPAPGSYAAFDVNDSGNPTATQPGFAGMDDGSSAGSATSFSATQNGISLTVNSVGTQDRDRGIDADLAGNAKNILLSDFVYATDSQNVTLDIAGLKPNTEYIVRMYGHDATGNNNWGSIWFQGPQAAGLGLTHPDFLAGNINLQAAPDAGDFDLRLTSSASGELQLTGRGANFTGASGSLAFVNGLEVLEPGPMYDVAKFDVDNINSGGGPLNRTEAGFVPLALSGTGSTTGSATDNGITVTVTTDRTDTPSRDRNNTGEALVADFIFGSELDILIEGLEAGKEYELTIWSQDTNGNSGYSSLWYQDGSSEPFRAGHLNANNPNNLDVAAFTAFLTANSSSMLLHAEAANSSRNLVFFNGLQLRTVPEPGTAVLLGLGGLWLAGCGVRRRRRAG